MDTHGYAFCEVCGRSDRPTSVHHIYYASKFPKHKNLHNFRNLILVCIPCHKAFHSGEYKIQFTRLEEERGLKELFK